jgi:hypothetical protein
MEAKTAIKEARDMKTMAEGCPSCQTAGTEEHVERVLKHWPIQIKLIGTVAPFLNDADVLVAADCTAFAVKDFHEKHLGDKKLLIGCPKLDGGQFYVDKFTEILENIPIKSLSVLRVEVPCCGGMTMILKEAIKRSGRKIPLRETVVGVRGNLLGECEVPVE